MSDINPDVEKMPELGTRIFTDKVAEVFGRLAIDKRRLPSSQ